MGYLKKISHKIIKDKVIYKEEEQVKKIINDPKNVVEEMVSGLVGAYPDYVKQVPETLVVARSDDYDQVALVSGGGSGHEPSHAGFVGDGMLSAAVCGQVFTSPTPDQIHEAIKATDKGKGTLMIVKNYSGDVMNFDMAKDLAEMDGIEVDSVLVDDDIAVEDSTYTQGRRGVAGTVLVHKIIGGMAREGKSVAELASYGKELVKDIKTVGIALSGATVPEVGKPGLYWLKMKWNSVWEFMANQVIAVKKSKDQKKLLKKLSERSRENSIGNPAINMAYSSTEWALLH